MNKFNIKLNFQIIYCYYLFNIGWQFLIKFKCFNFIKRDTTPGSCPMKIPYCLLMLKLKL